MAKTNALYEASVPVFLHYLGRLVAMLDKAEVSLSNARRDPSEILEARLAPDMFPFAQQVQTAVQFSLRISCPLADAPVPQPDADMGGFAGLRDRILHAQSVLKTLPAQGFADAAERPITETMGLERTTLAGSDFLYRFGLPNFFFHLAMAYAILRNQGVAMSKADFDGMHLYPEGFRFDDAE